MITTKLHTDKIKMNKKEKLEKLRKINKEFSVRGIIRELFEVGGYSVEESVRILEELTETGKRALKD